MKTNALRRAIQKGCGPRSRRSLITIKLPISIADSAPPILPPNLHERQVNDDGTVTHIIVHHLLSQNPPSKTPSYCDSKPFVISFTENMWSWFEVSKTVDYVDDNQPLSEIDCMKIIDLELWKTRNVWGQHEDNSAQKELLTYSNYVMFLYHGIDSSSIYYTFSVDTTGKTRFKGVLELKKRIDRINRLGIKAKIMKKFVPIPKNHI